MRHLTGRMRPGNVRRLLAVAGAAILALVLGACAAKTTTTGTAATSKASGKYPSMTVALLGGPTSDPWFGAFQKGAEAAGADLNVTVDYHPADYTAEAFSQAVQQMEAKKPNVMVVADIYASALDPLIKSATSSGLPTILYGSGSASTTKDGALVFIGQDEPATGKIAGQQSSKAGVTDGLCVIQNPGQLELEWRCQGYTAALKAAGGTAQTLNLPGQDGTNPTAITSDVQSYLQSHKSINGVFTLGTAVATSALVAVKNTGRNIKVGTTDLSTNVLNDVKSGQLMFTVDQQPYLQGYLSVLTASQYTRLGLIPSEAVWTGPNLVTKENVSKLLQINAKYPGIRGAA